MVDQIIRPSALPRRTNPVASEIAPVDNGTSVAGSTLAEIVDAGAPVASRSEAEAGVNNTKRMTALTTDQKIEYEIGRSLASKAQGDKADSAIQEIIPGSNVTIDYTDPVRPIVSSSGGGYRVYATVSEGLSSQEGPRGVGSLWQMGGFDYIEAAPASTDYDVQISSGVKLYVSAQAMGYNLLAFGWVLNDSSPSAKSINDGIMSKVVAKATGGAQGGILVVIPVGIAFYSETWNINRRDITVVGENRASTFLKFRPATDIPAIDIGTDSGVVIQNISLTGFTIEGAEVGQESVASLGLRVFHWRYLTIDIGIFRFNKTTTGLGAHFIGGDRAANHYSAYHRINLNVDSCTNNGLFIGSTIAGEDAPVNDGRWDLRVAGTGGNRGVVLHQGYQNIITGDIELYDTLLEVYANGNWVSHTIFEQAQSKGLIVGPLVKEFGVIGSSISSSVEHQANWPIAIDSYNGNIAWRSINGAGHNLLINGDFFDGANGLGNWNGANLFWTGSRWVYRNSGGTSPSGPFVFSPRSFKQNTWYTIEFDALLETGASVPTAALRFRVNGATDPGYNTGSGESTLQAEAAVNINGGTINPAQIPSSHIPNDGVKRRFAKRFYTGGNSGFPSTLELYSTTGAFTGGALVVDNIVVYEGTVAPLFQLSVQDLEHRKTGSLQYSVADTLPVYTTSFSVNPFGGHYPVDTSGANITATLPSAKAAGRGVTVFFKKLASSNTLTVQAATGQNIDGANTYPISTQWGKVTLVSNGFDRWYVVAP